MPEFLKHSQKRFQMLSFHRVIGYFLVNETDLSCNNMNIANKKMSRVI